MRANLNLRNNELVISEYSLIEEEGILSLLTNNKGIEWYYGEEDKKPPIILKAVDDTPNHLLKFLNDSEIAVTITT